jgi:hypothetical protein
MRRAQFLAVIWTYALAIPFTAMALVGAAFLTEHITDIANALTNAAAWQNLGLEASARWPEVAGMIVGQLVILLLLLIVRPEKAGEEASH